MCHFLECEMEQFETKQQWLQSTDPTKGIIVQLENGEYVYPPKEQLTDEQFVGWAENIEHADLVYYSVPVYTITNIPRMKDWFNENKSRLKATHDKLMHLQSDYSNFQEFKDSFKDPQDSICML